MQGHDLEMGTNCLGPYLLSVLLEPVMRRTAVAEKAADTSSVRVVWVSSMIAANAPKGGVVMEAGRPTEKFKKMERYMQTKAGVVLLASEFAKKLGGEGIISVVSVAYSMGA